jgi:hypothetical protein
MVVWFAARLLQLEHIVPRVQTSVVFMQTLQMMLMIVRRTDDNVSLATFRVFIDAKLLRVRCGTFPVTFTMD